MDIEEAMNQGLIAFRDLTREGCILEGIDCDEKTLTVAIKVMTEMQRSAMDQPEIAADMYVAIKDREDIEIPVKWWNTSITKEKRLELIKQYYPEKNLISITDSKIKYIWKKETGKGDQI